MPHDLFNRAEWTNRINWEAGQWYHFVAILDSQDHTNNAIFVDGVDDTSDLVGVPPSVSINMDFSADINIGGKYCDPAHITGERYFQGCIDDVRIYDYKLDVREVADLTEVILP